MCMCFIRKLTNGTNEQTNVKNGVQGILSKTPTN
jgi:hypothetical protein